MIQTTKNQTQMDQNSPNRKSKKLVMDGTEKTKKTWWKKDAPSMPGRTRSCNVIKFTQGPKGPALNANSPEELWGVFITPDIIRVLVEHTNSMIAVRRDKYAQSCRTHDTDDVEMKALIGLLMLAGTYHTSRLNLEDMWKNDGTGIEVFRMTMSLNRFRFLLCCLRFDDKATREERKKVDKLAPIRHIFEMFVENCKKNYTPSEYVTIDAMVVAFRGKAPFRQYIPSKPAKYGIKIHSMCDAKTFYVCNMEIYAGLQPEGPYKADKGYNSAYAVVKRLTSPISGSARNVTFDNWYTSYPLVDSLVRDHNLTAVGTLRKNKREIPKEFLDIKKRPTCDSLFGFGDQLTLVSYIPRKKSTKKNVVLISSMHRDKKIDEATGEDKKPEIITFYNSTKGGVDVVDMMMDKYSVSRNSRRWPLTVFFALLNISCVNSYVLYVHNPQNTLKRRKFIKQASFVLLQDTLKRRCQNMRLPKSLREGISKTLPETAVATPSASSQPSQTKAKRCEFCPRSKDRKVKSTCSTCKKNVCSDHSKMCVTCTECENADNGCESE
ncbi:uncharacterized protein LOC122242824 [Penaeus japonicus]|uniref:uncharacterized protein LOC122242824 n=1 Tax=Penaeus japonicus TaxID=27405 RepID=UPI001C711BB4|nr:uncharacterized protein LOC122242824 [Penaeus japonicus]